LKNERNESAGGVAREKKLGKYIFSHEFTNGYLLKTVSNDFANGF
jgi:hypothetical protein